MKRTIIESQLRKMIAESIKSTLNEIGETEAGQWMLGRLAAKNRLNANDAEKYFDSNAFQNGVEIEGGDDEAWWENEYYENGNFNDNARRHNDKYWKDLNDYGDKMKSMIRRNAMNGRNQAIKEDEEFDEMQFEKEREILRKYCNQVARPIRTLMDNVNKFRPIYCKEDFDKIYDAAGIIATYADVDGLSAETDIRYKNNG